MYLAYAFFLLLLLLVPVLFQPENILAYVNERRTNTVVTAAKAATADFDEKPSFVAIKSLSWWRKYFFLLWRGHNVAAAVWLLACFDKLSMKCHTRKCQVIGILLQTAPFTKQKVKKWWCEWHGVSEREYFIERDRKSQTKSVRERDSEMKRQKKQEKQNSLTIFSQHLVRRYPVAIYTLAVWHLLIFIMSPHSYTMDSPMSSGTFIAVNGIGISINFWYSGFTNCLLRHCTLIPPWLLSFWVYLLIER